MNNKSFSEYLESVAKTEPDDQKVFNLVIEQLLTLPDDIANEWMKTITICYSNNDLISRLKGCPDLYKLLKKMPYMVKV